MNEINFAEEYEKLQKKSNEYDTQYNTYLKCINIRELVNKLNESDILNESTKNHFNSFFSKIYSDPNDVRSNDTKSKNKKIKRKILLRYLHPDKIEILYGREINEKYQNTFSEIVMKINNDHSTPTMTILTEICESHHAIFEIVIDKLSQDKILNPDDVASIKEKAKTNNQPNDEKKSNSLKFQFETLSSQNEYYNSDYKSNFYNSFPIYVHTFVMMYNRIQKSSPIERFGTDLFLLLECIFQRLRDIVRTHDLLQIQFSPIDIVPNIMQLLKLNNHIFFDTMLSIKQFVPNCYAKMISLFYLYKITEGGKYYIRDEIFIGYENFSKEIAKDFEYGTDKHTLTEMEKIINSINPDFIDQFKEIIQSEQIKENKQFKEFDQNTESINVIKNFIFDIRKLKTRIKNTCPENINELERVDMFNLV